MAAAACASVLAAEVHVETTTSGRRVFTNTPVKASGAPARSAIQLGRGKIEPLVQTYSDEYQLDPELVHALIRAESGYNSRAISSKGAMGLMQLMPGTARALAVEDAFDPAANIAGGTRYLRMMLDEFEGRLEFALAGYNAGPKAVRQFGGIPPFPETRRYIEQILRDYRDDLNYKLPSGGGLEVGRKVHMARDRDGKLVISTYGDN